MLKFRVFMLILLVVAAVSVNALPIAAQESPLDCALVGGDAVIIDTARLYIEYNYTDADLGVHGAFDDHGWSELCVYDPNGVLVLAVKPQSQLQDLSMAGIFFESREPPTGEFDFDDLIAQFPEGEYTVVGTNYDGSGLTGVATFTHDAPQPPTVTYPPLAEEEDEADESAEFVVSADELVIEWDAVTETVFGDPLTITGYEVIITLEDYDDPNGFSQPIFDVHVPDDRNSLTVSAEFLEPDTVYELEVLALEASGNQTITVGFFKTGE